MASLVPPTVSSPLGILDITALQFLLSSPTRSSTKERCFTEVNDRPASSELARAYGVTASSNGAASSHRRRVVDAKKRRRPPVPSKLAPMPTHSERNGEAKQLAPPNNGRPARLAKHRAGRQGAASIESATGVVEAATAPARNQVVKPSAHPHVVPNDGLRQEIQWIYAHLPVRRLANAQCSLALRRRVLTETLRTNLSRAWLRDALLQWRWCISKQKEVEASKLKSFDRLVDLFSNVLRNQVAHRFLQWKEMVDDSQDLEWEAAAASIQIWLVDCRQRREARRTRASLDVARAVEIAGAKAAMIQRAFRGFAARQLLARSLDAIKKIQRFVRSTRRRRQLTEQREATRKMEELYAQVRREHRLQLLLARTRANEANKIITHWRQYAAWREQLAKDYVFDLVDRVEFFAAVQSIQSHIRGYQCRFRMKRKLRSAHCIQRAWRQYFSRQRGRQERKMMMLTQNMAASCLQRTFQRNRERKKHRAAMQKSTRPMYMRALTQTKSFRQRFYVPIVKSAVSVIQSTWRRHVKYQRWMTTRQAAARRIQRWQHSVRTLFRWQHAARLILRQNCESRRLEAVGKLQRWLRACLHFQRDLEEAVRTQQLVEMLKAVMAIQRHYRRKHDKWRHLLRAVLLQRLPPFRRAANRIARCWRQYSVQKRRVMDRLQGLDATIGTMGLSELQELLQQHERQRERQDRAACVIQRTCKRFRDKRDGKLLLKRYKMLFQKELRRKQQRNVIHGFLEEKHQERAKRSQLHVSSDVATPASASSSPLSFLGQTLTSSPGASGPLVASSSSSSSSLSSSSLPPTATTTPPRPTQQHSPMETSVASVSSDERDDPDVAKCWSDEYKCHYWFNARTGESTWV